MGNVKPQICVLVKLGGRASVVISVYRCLDVNMEIVPYLWNVAVKMDGLEPIVIFVSIIVQVYWRLSTLNTPKFLSHFHYNNNLTHKT